MKSLCRGLHRKQIFWRMTGRLLSRCGCGASGIQKTVRRKSTVLASHSRYECSTISALLRPGSMESLSGNREQGAAGCGECLAKVLSGAPKKQAIHVRKNGRWVLRLTHYQQIPFDSDDCGTTTLQPHGHWTIPGQPGYGCVEAG